jgi:ankyrin repeat protein
MQFSNKDQRNQHPQARLIPEAVWSEVFRNDSFPDSLCSWMNMSYEELKEQSMSVPSEEKNMVWIAIAISHPTLKNQQLIEIGEHWGLSALELLNLAVMVGDDPKHLELVTSLSQKTPYSNTPLSNYCLIIQRSAKCGHLKTLEYFIELIESNTPDKLQDLIAADNFYAFRETASYGHLDVLKYLEKKAPDTLQDMIAADSFYAFRVAASYGHLDVLKYLEKKEPDKLQDMIAARNFSAFRVAAIEGYFDVIEYLAKKAPDTLQNMIAARGFQACQSAAIHGHLDVLKYLVKNVAPDRRQEMITTNNFFAFQWVVAQGHFDILKHLVENVAPDAQQEMIAADGFYAFQSAAAKGHFDVLEYLAEKAPDRLQDMIATEAFAAFRESAKYDHLDVLKFLVKNTAPDTLQDMIAAKHFYALHSAASQNHVQVVHYLLNHLRAFTYAEAHQYEYGERYVTPFVMQRLTTLRSQQQQVEANNLDVVFNVTPEEAIFLFYIARNLIRRNETDLIDDLRFLLSIPAVKNLAHMEVSANQPNELLRLALSVSNREAATVLITISAVRILAEQNNYYRDEQQGRLDLGALAADHESSITALTQGEQQQLQEVTDHYGPLLRQAGITQVMTDLRNTLEAHYEARPATLTLQRNDHSKESITLPMAWSDFEALHLNPEQKEQAFKAYYQNKAHTAWRYLFKPNHWMHEHASYVNINDDGTERWSTFEEYQLLISLLYLAAIDEETPCIDAFTLETRLEHFIDELAHIGRAHNWDKSRLKDNGEEERYDDLEGDRPSCFSGVKRRLFQAVLGHPLLKLVTDDIIKVEINEFLMKHFKEAINTGNLVAIKKAWDKGIDDDELNDEDTKAIQSLNVSLEQQQVFKNYLSNKYGSSFTTNLSFIFQVANAFLLTPPTSAHLFKHGGLMMEFFSKLNATNSQLEGLAQYSNRFFAVSASNHQTEEPPTKTIQNRGV